VVARAVEIQLGKIGQKSGKFRELTVEVLPIAADLGDGKDLSIIVGVAREGDRYPSRYFLEAALFDLVSDPMEERVGDGGLGKLSWESVEEVAAAL
jgi:hypothetical protein